MRRKLSDKYEEVKTPQVIDRSLWEKSGHWDKFKEHMFMAKGDDEKTLALKPMNCPGHVQIYKQGLKSYKDLPIRMAEFGSCHRNEPSGALHGIMRVRQFTQDDAHIFCMHSQITSECVSFCGLLQQIYKDFGFKDLTVKFSDRPETRAGDERQSDQEFLGITPRSTPRGAERGETGQWTLGIDGGAIHLEVLVGPGGYGNERRQVRDQR